MPSRTAGHRRAAHREVLAQTKAVVANWAATGPHRSVAISILDLLAPCAHDEDGDRTLDAVAAAFEEHGEALPRVLVLQLEALAAAAHCVAQEPLR